MGKYDDQLMDLIFKKWEKYGKMMIDRINPIGIGWVAPKNWDKPTLQTANTDLHLMSSGLQDAEAPSQLLSSVLRGGVVYRCEELGLPKKHVEKM